MVHELPEALSNEEQAIKAEPYEGGIMSTEADSALGAPGTLFESVTLNSHDSDEDHHDLHLMNALSNQTIKNVDLAQGHNAMSCPPVDFFAQAHDATSCPPVDFHDSTSFDQTQDTPNHMVADPLLFDAVVDDTTTNLPPSASGADSDISDDLVRGSTSPPAPQSSTQNVQVVIRNASSPDTPTTSSADPTTSVGPKRFLLPTMMKGKPTEDRAKICQDPERVARALAAVQARMREELSPPNHSSGTSCSDAILAQPSTDSAFSGDHTDTEWMNTVETPQEDEVENAKAAEVYKAAKAKYDKMKRQGKTTVHDDINMLRLEREENARVKRMSKAEMTEDSSVDVPADENEDDHSLFIPERPARGSKRGSGHEDGDNGYELVETPPSKRQKGKSGRRKDKLTAGEIREATANKVKKKGKSAPKPRKSTKKEKSKTEPKKGHKKRSNHNNIHSLWTSNVVKDAQANAGQAAIPTFNSTRRDEALKQLIASIPTAERGGNISSDKNAILEAPKAFSTQRAIRSDQNGGWLLKGMTSSLFHHQLLGTAWMRKRETEGERPHGGFVADEMGFGKTIQMIANILDDRVAARKEADKTTLIVVTPALMGQWLDEFRKHCEPNSVGKIIKYGSGHKLDSADVVGDLRTYDCIITTYGEVRKSYPVVDAPVQLQSEAALNAWWKQHYLDNAGPLHKIRFRRIVLDEAQAIKNLDSKTSKAVRSLIGHYRWLISGTPLQNYLEELYSYLDFLRCPNTGSFDLFKANYCDDRSNPREPLAHSARVAHLLQGIMLRRTHAEKLFSRPIVVLPGIDSRTEKVQFNAVERFIYRLIKSRFIERINTLSKDNKLQSHWNHVLTMMHHLRRLTSHILLLQNVLKESLHAEDIESLWQLTASEVQSSTDTPNTQSLRELRKLITAKRTARQTKTTSGSTRPTDAEILASMNDEEDPSLGGKFALTFKFRKFLRKLKENQTWVELQARSMCYKCKQPPDEPFVTSCMHLYCKECLQAMANESAANGLDSSSCLECGALYTATSTCEGLKELGWEVSSPKEDPKRGKKNTKSVKKNRQKSTKRRQSLSISPGDESDSNEDTEKDDSDDWIIATGDLLPSAKTTAAKAQILDWLRNSPNEKIVIFTQWMDMIRILERMCNIEKWGCVAYSGSISFETRNRNVKTFADDPNCKIMLCSLKAGGVGLNLVMASKVLILDLFWNESIERQAFCRCFRIGQTKPVEIIRYVVKDSIDEDLVNMQERKTLEIDSVMGDEARRDFASVERLLELFGPVKEDEEGRDFIFVGDEAVDEGDVDMATWIPRRPI